MRMSSHKNFVLHESEPGGDFIGEDFIGEGSIFIDPAGQMRLHTGKRLDDDPCKPPLINILHLTRQCIGLDGSVIQHFRVHGDMIRLIVRRRPEGEERWWEPYDPRLIEEEEATS